MTEEQAIERVRRALIDSNHHDTCMPFMGRQAVAAWNEIKAIAREEHSEPPDWFKRAYSDAILDNLRT